MDFPSFASPRSSAASVLPWVVRVLAVAGLALVAISAAPGRAHAQQCRVVEMQMTPSSKLQIVAWVEDPAGGYVDTAYITHATGQYGIGNRPGIMEFNSGPGWPYGPRETVFPVWSHRHGLTFPAVVYQNSNPESDRNLSHPYEDSSPESHFCRPLEPDGRDKISWDAGSCPSSVFSDKGVFSDTRTSRYPPRSDVRRDPKRDSESVDLYRQLNPFDSVSRATPVGGVNSRLSWTIPSDVKPGNYVLWVEVAKEFDHNASYTAEMRPSASPIPWATYGMPYRGQPSVLYKVPFVVADQMTTAHTATWVGYGDPDGQDGMVRAPDSTISTAVPGSGAARLSLVPDGGDGYRVKVIARPEFDSIAPGAPTEPIVTAANNSEIVLTFEAPGDDGATGRVTEYEIRVRAGEPINEANFESSMPISTSVEPDDPGQLQTVTLTGLLPETRYFVAVRALDDCRNPGPLMVVDALTSVRRAGEVDACFIATAAYGSKLANEVDMLRHFRDSMLASSLLGELAVVAYYTFGPTVAGVVGESDLLRSTARSALDPIVRRVGALQH
jgi:Fibronectin type III domain